MERRKHVTNNPKRAKVKKKIDARKQGESVILFFLENERKRLMALLP